MMVHDEMMNNDDVIVAFLDDATAMGSTMSITTLIITICAYSEFPPEPAYLEEDNSARIQSSELESFKRFIQLDTSWVHSESRRRHYVPARQHNKQWPALLSCQDSLVLFISNIKK